MGTVQKRAEKVKAGLHAGHPKLRKTVINQLALAVGAMLEVQTPNPSELATVLPVVPERQEIREQGLRRWLKKPLLARAVILEPFARTVLAEAARNGQTIRLSLDPTELGDRFALLRLALQAGARSLPLAGQVEAGAANLGFAGQPGLLERVQAWLPPNATVLRLGERFYPSAAVLAWWQQHGWQYRRRVKGNLTVDPGFGATTTGELADGVTERDLPEVRLCHHGVPTNLGILHQAGQETPWLIALDCQPTQAAVRDSGARWVIEPTFSDCKRRGCQREETQLQAPDRLDRFSLILTLAMDGWVRIGRDDALYHPTSLEKKPTRRPIRTMGASNRLDLASWPGSHVVSVYCSDGCKLISPYQPSSVRS